MMGSKLVDPALRRTMDWLRMKGRQKEIQRCNAVAHTSAAAASAHQLILVRIVKRAHGDANSSDLWLFDIRGMYF